MKFIAGALLLCLASAASAATLVGGGATLPAIGYTGVATGTPITVASGAGSLFGTYIANHSGTGVTYCPTGSGAGKKILAGNVAGATVNDACPSGFGGSGLTQAHFAGSDAPMSVSEYNAYVTGHGASAQPTQLPAIAGAVGIVFKKTNVNTLTLTEAQICGIFGGTITNWNQLPGGQSGAINVVYRSDNSGTSFSFLNHLSAVCPGITSSPSLGNFSTVQGYPTGASSYITSYASSVPAGGASGNAAVVTAVAATDGSIGYAEVANGTSGGVRVASVTNLAGKTINPLTAFGPTAVPVTLTFDSAISDSVTTTMNGPNGLAGRPILVGLPNSSNGCIALVAPDSYANLAPASAAGTSAENLYPIVAITSLLGNAQGNGTDAAAVQGLLSSPYDLSIRSTVTKIGRAGTGYAWLSNDQLTAARVTTCIN